ncbi:hypothetical protein FRC17_006134 [Serendipita sp. 399]|nr:hypothetical protein FRC17_006134 [Serendipita sp. 399]
MTDRQIVEHRTFKDYGPGNLEILEEEEEEDTPHFTFRTLVKPFVIKQWVYKGKIYREKRERVPSRFELFFDLVFVAIAHQLSDSAADHASGVGLAQFILASYTVNASAITLFYKSSNEGYAATPTTEASPSSEAGGHLLAAVAEAAAETGSALVGNRDAALVTATVYFLLAKAFRILFFVMYAAALPNFRIALIFQCVNQVIGFLLYLPLLFVHNKKAIVILASLGMAWEILMRYTIGIYRISLGNLPDRFKYKAPDSKGNQTNDPSSVDNVPRAEEEEGGMLGSYVPALNIEHFLERTAAFVVIVLGEMVLGVVYHATPEQVGFKAHRFLHALRRHWFTGLTFTTLHFPLSAALILAGAATSRMTSEDEVSQAIRWYFGGGLGVAMFALSLIGFTHRSLDSDGTTRVGRNTQLLCRGSIGVIMICLPLSNLNPLEMMGTCAGLTGFLVVEETYGKLHRGEPIAKPSASEQDAADLQAQQTDEAISKGDEIKEEPIRKADQ